MANRYPLIVDSSSQQIKELPSGDTLVIDNLQVTGTTTSIETATLNVEDKNITLNYSTGDSTATADGSGLTFQDAVDASTDATILWDTTNDRFQFSHGVEVTSGNVGIGTSSPSNPLHIDSGATTVAQRIDTNISSSEGNVDFLQAYTTNNYASSLNLIREGTTNTGLAFKTTGSGTLTERMRVDSSGNVLVGKTTVDTLGTVGTEIQADGQIYVTHNGNTTMRLNRLTSDGTIIDFRKDGSTVGSIGTQGGEICINQGSVGIRLRETAGTLIPIDGNRTNLDNTLDLGSSGARFKDLYLSGVAKIDSSAYISQSALTSTSNSVAWNAATQANAYHLLTENTTFAAPSNAVEGAIISVEIAQGGTPYTVAWNTVFEFAASTAPTMTATANKTDIFSFRYNGSIWQEIGRVQNMAQT